MEEEEKKVVQELQEVMKDLRIKVLQQEREIEKLKKGNKERLEAELTKQREELEQEFSNKQKERLKARQEIRRQEEEETRRNPKVIMKFYCGKCEKVTETDNVTLSKNNTNTAYVLKGFCKCGRGIGLEITNYDPNKFGGVEG